MSDCSDDEAFFMLGSHTVGSDGVSDRKVRLKQKLKYIPAIFIHAGAGFHSIQNERFHLEACVA